MNRRNLKLISIGFLIFLTSFTAQAQERELIVNYKLVDGECFYENNWNKVSGSIIYWNIIDVKSNRLIQEHSYDFLSAENINNLSASNELKLKYFQILYPSTDIYQLPFLKKEINFLSQKRKELNDNNLQIAQLIFETDEHSLYRLNSVYKEINFKEFSSAKVLVPGNFTICRLKSNILMKGSKARFTKNFFGQVTIKSDETISVRPGKKTFAAELFK
jgi:hypothetical protein